MSRICGGWNRPTSTWGSSKIPSSPMGFIRACRRATASLRPARQFVTVGGGGESSSTGTPPIYRLRHSRSTIRMCLFSRWRWEDGAGSLLGVTCPPTTRLPSNASPRSLASDPAGQSCWRPGTSAPTWRHRRGATADNRLQRLLRLSGWRTCPHTSSCDVNTELRMEGCGACAGKGGRCGTVWTNFWEWTGVCSRKSPSGNPWNNLDHFMVLGYLHGTTQWEHSCYLGHRRQLPLCPLRQPTQEDWWLATLVQEITKPPPR